MDKVSNIVTDEAEARDRERATHIGEAAVDSSIVALGVAHPGLAALIAVIGVPAKLLLEKFVARTNKERVERATYALILGVALAGIPVDEFDKRCEEDPDLALLCAKVVLAAQDAAFQDKLYGLARSLASALEDGSRVSAEILFATIISQVEAPHVRLLAQFERPRADIALTSDARPEDQDPEQNWYNAKQLAMLDPGLEHVLAPLLGVLASNGLIQRAGQGGMGFAGPGPEITSYSITDFGKELLGRLRAQPLDAVTTKVASS
ncbi:MAG TPA: hypothetical protein VFQ44_22345 [Streptosporangiaceae bacterium]|nr:hypothetical protein [Streptosporangiaceae bacterium]